MIVDILIYVMFAWVMCWFAKTANVYGEGSLGAKYYIWYFILFYAVICGIRYNVGVDHLSYVYSFKKGYSARDNEALWALFVKATHAMGAHYSIALGLVALAQIYFIVKAVKGCQYVLAALPILLFGGFYFLTLNNGLRQMTAICVFTFASRFIVDRKPVPYFLLMFLSSLVHHTALITLPLYALAYLPEKIESITKYRNVCVCVLFACLFLGMTPVLQDFVKQIEGLTTFFGYDDYTARISSIVGVSGKREIRAFGLMQLSYFLVALAVTWFGPLLKERYEGEVRYFNLWYFLAYIYGCGYFLICNTSHLFIRIVEYFAICQLIVASMLLYLFWQLGSKYRLYAQIFVLVIWMNICWDVAKCYGIPREAVTYKVFFLHDKSLWKVG